MLSYIKVNDIFDELIDENKKLRECLKVFIEYKISVDLYLKDITIASDSVNQQNVIKLSKEVEDVFNKRFDNQMVIKICEQNIIRVFVREEEKREEVSPQNSNLKLDSIEEFNNFGSKQSIVSKEISSTEEDMFLQNNIKREILDSEDNQCFPITENIIQFNNFNKISSNVGKLQINSINENNRQFECNSYDKSFVSNGELLTHDKTYYALRVAGDDPKCEVQKTQHSKKFQTTTSQNSTEKQMTNLNESQNFGECKSSVDSGVEDFNFLSLNPNILDKYKKRHISPNVAKLQINSNENNRLFECNSCDKTFVSKGELSTQDKTFHALRVAGDDPKREVKKTKPSIELRYVCTVEGCSQKFETLSMLSSHTMNRHNTSLDKEFKCDYKGCGKTYKYLSHLKIHERSHSNAFNCNWSRCQFKTKCRCSLRTHSKTVHNNKRNFNVDRPQLNCIWTGCEYQTKCESCLRTHSEHIHSNENNFICDWPQCGKRFKTNSYLKTHFRTHKRINDRLSVEFYEKRENNRQFECNSCEKPFISKGELSKQEKTSHALPVAGDDPKFEVHKTNHKTSSVKKFKCDYKGCGKTFNWMSYLKVHERSHSNVLLDCNWPGCQYQTKYDYDLRTHSEHIHSNENNLICDWPQCGQRFETNYNLKTHEMEYHLNSSTNEYSCDYTGCQYKTNKIQYLRTHTKNVHNSQPLACDWPGCQFQTKNKKSLSNHSIVHRTEKKFNCDWPQCGKRFTRKDSLKPHMKIHLNDKPFAFHSD